MAYNITQIKISNIKTNWVNNKVCKYTLQLLNNSSSDKNSQKHFIEKCHREMHVETTPYINSTFLEADFLKNHC